MEYETCTTSTSSIILIQYEHKTIHRISKMPSRCVSAAPCSCLHRSNMRLYWWPIADLNGLHSPIFYQVNAKVFFYLQDGPSHQAPGLQAAQPLDHGQRHLPSRLLCLLRRRSRHGYVAALPLPEPRRVRE
ncbi:hypothetical protein PPTG_05202 [Phytophthora nicotianae INRA-310]|uniref:Uncharacterized protein n=1 Tax=Phytophthora nicotianae (strain INRA-310) TaxID=761204 RepID=W2QY76_PHYN3|nr:hypothetical protein PPTG_05202 [Phytophthora nicotianae INRA-310]ETN17389.1 hypothetical protein PPTG_05202 [Phytophthora nicotianae INRA-310]